MANLMLVPDPEPGDYFAMISAEDFVPALSFINQTADTPRERREAFQIIRNEEAQCASK